MREVNKIDKAFVDKLSDVEKEPSERLWAAIITSVGTEQHVQKPGSRSWLSQLTNRYSIVAVIGIAVMTSVYFLPSDKGSIANKAEETSKQLSAPSLVEGQTLDQPAESKLEPKASQIVTDVQKQAETENVQGKEGLSSGDRDLMPQASSATITMKNTGKVSRLNILYIEKVNNKYMIAGLADSATLRVVDEPRHGKVAIDPQTKKFSYLPNQGFVGVDSFTYVIINAKGISSNKGMIKIVVEDDKSETSPVKKDHFEQSSLAYDDSMDIAGNYNIRSDKDKAVVIAPLEDVGVMSVERAQKKKGVENVLMSGEKKKSGSDLTLTSRLP